MRYTIKGMELSVGVGYGSEQDEGVDKGVLSSESRAPKSSVVGLEYGRPA